MMKSDNFSSLLLLVLMTAGFLFSGCEPIPEPMGRGGVEVTLNLRPQGGGPNALGLSGASQLGTSLIVAVHHGAAFTGYLQDLATSEILAADLLNLATSKVNLTLPLEFPLQFLEYTYNDSLTLAEIWGETPPAGPPQVSTSFTIDNATTAVSVSMPLLTDGFNEDFSAMGLDPQVWENTYLSRGIVTSPATPMVITLAAQDIGANNQLEPVDFTTLGVSGFNDITSLQADLKVTAITTTGASSNPHARLGGRFYHTATTGEAGGSAVGDVHAEINLNGTDARYMVGICGAVVCGSGNFTILTNGFVSLGTVAKGTVANLALAWDSTAQVFTFTLDGGTPVTFNPVAAGAPVSGAANRPWKSIGNRIGLGRGSEGSIAAEFGSVTLNGKLYDDFSTPAGWINPSKWNRQEFSLTNSGKVVALEARRSYGVNPGGTGSATSLYGNRNRFLNNHRVGGILSVQSYNRMDAGATAPAVEVRAFPALSYQPRANRGNSLNLSEIRVMLRDNGAGLKAGLQGFFCLDSTCSTNTLGQNGTDGSGFPVEDLGTGSAPTPKLPFTIEYQGHGLFQAVLDGHLRTVDMSGIPGWKETDFVQPRFRSEVRNINEATEEGSIVAHLAAVELGDGAKDSLPPGRVHSVAFSAESSLVNLTWVNPADVDFIKVEVLRATPGTVLTGPGDTINGSSVYSGVGASATDSGLVNGKYDYYFYTADKAGNISAPKVVIGTAGWSSGVTNPVLTAGASVQDVAISWENPQDSALSGINVFRADGTQVFFNELGACLTDRTSHAAGSTIYYKYQAFDTTGNTVSGDFPIYTLPVSVSPPNDSTPPDPVSGLTATVVTLTAGGTTGGATSAVQLDWANPRNANNCDLVGVRIARQSSDTASGGSGSFPTGPTDNESGFNPPTTTSAPLNAVTWSDLTVASGTTYFYAVFTEDSSGNINPTGATVTIAVP